MSLNRSERIKALEDITFDVIVIGGGATGLGTAVDASSRGFSTLLLEQNDYGKGTSSRSTKILHGGVRYLAQGNISLVREALREKLLVYKNAPHLARPMNFVIPCENIFKQAFYAAGMLVYDALAGFPKNYLSKMVGKKTLNEKLAEIDIKHKNKGVIYNDGQFDDARMAFALAKTLENNGGQAFNYLKVTQFIKDKSGKIVGVEALDRLAHQKVSIKAKCVFNTTGIYSDKIIELDVGSHQASVTLSQGIHIVVNKSVYTSNHAMLIPKTTDGRVLFFIPWYNKVIIGTTDTQITDVLDDPIPLKEEIELIISNANAYLTNPIKKEDITSVFAGIRPLIKVNTSTKNISREEHITISESGLISVIGGKWTTFRHMGEKIINFAIKNKQLPDRHSKTRNMKIYGYLPEEEANNISLGLRLYGSDLEKIKKMKGYSNNFHKDLPINEAQVRWAVEQEQAVSLDDILARRTRCLFINALACIEIADTVAKIMQEVMEKDDLWREEEVKSFMQIAEKYSPLTYLP